MCQVSWWDTRRYRRPVCCYRSSSRLSPTIFTTCTLPLSHWPCAAAWLWCIWLPRSPTSTFRRLTWPVSSCCVVSVSVTFQTDQSVILVRIVAKSQSRQWSSTTASVWSLALSHIMLSQSVVNQCTSALSRPEVVLGDKTWLSIFGVYFVLT